MGVNFDGVIERMRWVGRLKNDSAVARALDVTPQALSNYKKRGEMPSDLVLKFSNIFGVSLDWLITGSGEVYRPGSVRAAEDTAVYQSQGGVKKTLDLEAMTPDEIIYVGKLLKVLRGADKNNSNAIKCAVDSFVTASNAEKATGTGE